jgi:hypothetical protein
MTEDDDVLNPAPPEPLPEEGETPMGTADLLGAPHQVDSDRPELGYERWIGSGPLPRGQLSDVFLGLLFLVSGLLGLALSTKIGDKIPEEYRTYAWAAAGGGAALSLLGILLRFRGSRIHITAFENGLVYSTGGRSKTVRFVDVSAVTEKRVAMVIHHGDSAGRRHLIRIKLKNAAEHRLEVGALADSEKLAEIVHESTLPHLMPRVVETLTNGRAVAFGRLVLAPHGLTFGGETLIWDKMANITLTNGILTVRAKGEDDPWYAGDCGAIPNVQVLLNLIRSRFLSTDTSIAKNKAVTDSRYSVLDKYIGGAAGGRRFG